MRARDIFTTVNIPDLFMETVEKRGEWYLFDPHEVKSKKGWYLQDFYDEKRGEGSFREKYQELVEDNNIEKEVVKAIDIFKSIMRAQLEGGTPFMFYRDTANRLNPNKHAGIIYATNLCTEISQNLSPSSIEKRVIDGNTVVTYEDAGDMVVCNLSSLNLAKVAFMSDKELEKLVDIQFRALDNTIDLNELPVERATITNNKYRAVGGGTFGLHHALALKGYTWDSQEALDFNDEIYEKINYYAVKASANLAVEKGAYPLFEGSDWDTGQYFDDRNYTSDDWLDLREQIADTGIRNGYLMAVAPNISTAQIAGTTPSIDPIFDLVYYVENNNGRKAVVAPDLNVDTYLGYGTAAVKQDQFASIAQNAVRQRHVDQAISFNLYIPKSIKVTTLLDLHLKVWDSGIKSTYYTRNSDTDVEECVWCQ